MDGDMIPGWHPGLSPGGDDGRRPPLTVAQRALWLLGQIHPGDSAYNVPLAVRLDGPLDVAALGRAIGRVLTRHDVLRTTFPMGGQEPYQRVAPAPPPIDLRPVDLTGEPAGRRDHIAGEMLRRWADEPFDVTTGPLVRTRLIRLDAGRHVLGLFLHQLVCDGPSLHVLFDELARGYAGEPEPPPLAVRFGEYAARWRPPDPAETAWWRERLAAAPTVIDFRAGAVRDATGGPSRRRTGANHHVRLPGSLMGGVLALARRMRVTPFVPMIAAYAVSLGDLTGARDLLIGTPVNERDAAELEPVIGFFVNTLPVRFDLSGDPSFAEVVRRTRESVTDLLAYRRVPFQTLVETLVPDRDPHHNPLVQALFSFEPTPMAEPRFAGLAASLIDLMPTGPKAGLDFTIFRAAPTGDDFDLTITYDTGLVDAGTVRAVGERYRQVLAAAVADPDAPVTAASPGFGAGERAPSVFSAAGRAPAPRTLLDVLEATADRFPDAAALDDGRVRLDYTGLRAEAGALADRLRAAGVRRGDRVGVCLPSGTAELYVSILGVLAAGAAYVPVDTEDPAERREFIFGEAGVHAVITGERHITVTDRCRSRGPAPGGAARPGPDDDAWVIFTSGSSGTPKGVVATHRGAAAFVDAEARLFLKDRPIGPGDRVQALLSAAFDASCEEMWLAWRNGACLVPAPRALVRTGADLGPWIKENGITVISTLPTLAARWPADAFDGVRLLILGGETCPPELIEGLTAPGREVWNSYGPTEATVTSCATPFNSGDPVRIGLPLDGWDLAVIGPDGEPVGMGEVGELVIGGVGLARYLDPRKDAEKYAPLPSLGWRRAYRSGDLVRAEPEGLVFAGRMDEQVKLGGRRVELGEVEAALRRLPGVAAAAAAVRTTRLGHQILVGYIVPDAGFDEDAARAGLRRTMPAALVPRLAVVADLPIRTSGKVDRDALPWPLPSTGAPDRPREAAPGGERERLLRRIWQEVLELDHIGAHDNFFDLGGTSFTLAAAHARLTEALGRRVPMVTLFEFPSIAALARHLDEEEGPAEPIEPADRRAAGRARLGLQRRRVDDHRATPEE
ncbi:non-ribosomal peptide synthetase [Spongiactinospora gelatinilytica]|nr:non-ribosomal peptide synthetase [Spongiactinospora gelatinilytica]